MPKNPAQDATGPKESVKYPLTKEVVKLLRAHLSTKETIEKLLESYSKKPLQRKAIIQIQTGLNRKFGRIGVTLDHPPTLYRIWNKIKDGNLLLRELKNKLEEELKQRLKHHEKDRILQSKLLSYHKKLVSVNAALQESSHNTEAKLQTTLRAEESPAQITPTLQNQPPANKKESISTKQQNSSGMITYKDNTRLMIQREAEVEQSPAAKRRPMPPTIQTEEALLLLTISSTFREETATLTLQETSQQRTLQALLEAVAQEKETATSHEPNRRFSTQCEPLTYERAQESHNAQDLTSQNNDSNSSTKSQDSTSTNGNSDAEGIVDPAYSNDNSNYPTAGGANEVFIPKESAPPITLAPEAKLDIKAQMRLNKEYREHEKLAQEVLKLINEGQEQVCAEPLSRNVYDSDVTDNFTLITGTLISPKEPSAYLDFNSTATDSVYIVGQAPNLIPPIVDTISAF